MLFVELLLLGLSQGVQRVLVVAEVRLAFLVGRDLLFDVRDRHFDGRVNFLLDLGRLEVLAGLLLELLVLAAADVEAVLRGSLVLGEGVGVLRGQLEVHRGDPQGLGERTRELAVLRLVLAVVIGGEVQVSDLIT